MHKEEKSIPQENELNSVLLELKSLTRRLELISFSCLSFTAANLGLMFLVLLNVFTPNSYIQALSLICCLLSIISSVFFDRTKRKGNAMYEEVSEELRWNQPAAKELSGEIHTVEKIPDFYIRVILRSFVANAEMPLVPSKFGPSFYVFLNISCFTILRMFQIT